jgi:hypothetical protein
MGDAFGAAVNERVEGNGPGVIPPTPSGGAAVKELARAAELERAAELPDMKLFVLWKFAGLWKLDRKTT